MTDDTPGRLLEVHEPDSVEQALDLHTRYGALSKWVNERKAEIARWAEVRADSRFAEDGARMTWRLDDGTVLQTGPKPTPRIIDPTRFAWWYVQEVIEGDIDTVPDEPHLGVMFDHRVVRTMVATAPSDALLLFLDDVARGAGGDELEVVLQDLVNAVEVTEQWNIDPATLDDLISGKLHPLPDGKARIAIAEPDGPSGSWAAVDRASGEVVPGTAVSPPGQPSMQFRPSTAKKEAVAQELRELLGPPALNG